ncbi:hypothetical protein [Haloarcula halophila]|uniref:hypothetical protein n=1 Tax=Haloarcula TaxID=2237 RepID=UPI0023E44D73|nr:hypothetical protein [Halomicroarcula sp. DFY41]
MARRTLVLVAVLALASVVLLVPTGAAPFTQSGTDSITGEVHLAPAEGPNGRYAVLDEDGEIEIVVDESNPYADADGVKENATTRIDDVFTITYTGAEQAKVWLTNDAEDVRFYRSGGAASTLEREDKAVVLGPNATVHVGLRIDTRGNHDVEQADSFTVHAEAPDESTPAPAETPEPTPTPEPSLTDESEDDGDDTTPTATETPTDANESDDSDRRTPTATPEQSVAPPTSTTDGGVGSSSIGGVGGVTPTATPSPTDAGRVVDQDPVGGQPTELGGFAQDPGVVFGALLVLLLLAYLLRRAAERARGDELRSE